MSQTNQETTASNTTPPNQTPIHPTVIRLLQLRGMDHAQIVEFFSNKLTELPDLTKMIDMEKTTERIVLAISQNQKIGIYGDYDVDGTTSCALFYHFFKLLDIEVEVFQPSRFVEGYGIHPASIDNALEKNVDLLISVDCGITNTQTADYATDKNLDLIITDHHTDAAEFIPKAFAVVNPNRRDEPADRPLGTLAGVGVAFAVCLSVKNALEKKGQKIPSIYSLLQFVAIGTICDMARLDPINLKLCRHGLKQIPTTEYYGIKAFFSEDERAAGHIESERIGFYVGPMINSKGRLEHPDHSLKLLISQNSTDAYRYLSELEVSNNQRKFITKEDFDRAKKKIVTNMDGNELISCITYDAEFHEGVIGIVASRLVDTFKVPAMVFTDSEDKEIIKASCRSAGDLNLFECLEKFSDLYTKFGGHKAAAGLSMPKENFKIFKAKMNEHLKTIPAAIRVEPDHYDLVVNHDEINIELIRGLQALEPFGMNNEKPIFRITDIKIADYKILKDAHVKWTFASKLIPNKKFFGISFNYINKWGELDPSELIKIQDRSNISAQFTLGLNRFNGNEYIQLMVEKILY